MATLTIRNFDDALKERLRIRAAEHGHSMEAEARRILQLALAENRRPSERNLYDRIHDRFAGCHQLPEGACVKFVGSTPLVMT